MRKKLATYFSTKSFWHILGVSLLALFLFFILVLGIYIGVVKLIDAMRPAPFKDGKVNLTVSRETTYVDGPVTDDGTINYAPHLLGEQKKLPPEKNAAFYLIKAIGPRIYGGPRYSDQFDALQSIVHGIGIADLPGEGEYIQDFRAFLDEYKKADKDEVLYRKELDFFNEGITDPWSKTDHPLLFAYLKKLRKTLELCVRAGEAEGLFIPLPEDNSVNCLELHFFFMQLRNRELFYAFKARILLLIGEGDAEAAQRELLAYHRLNALLTHRTVSHINITYGIFEDCWLFKVDSTFVLSGLVQGDALIDFSRQVASFRPSPQLWEQVLENQRFENLFDIMCFAQRALKNRTQQGFVGDWRGDVEWDYLLRQFNAGYDRLITISRTQDAAKRARLRRKLAEEISETKDAFHFYRSIRSHIGPFLTVFTTRRVATQWMAEEISNTASYIFTMQDRYQEVVARFDLTKVTCALAAYKQEQGSYPSSLTALKSHYLKTVPNDLFTGRPFHYEQKKKGEKFLLYSVGKDMKDDKGRAYRAYSDDIVVSH